MLIPEIRAEIDRHPEKEVMGEMLDRMMNGKLSVYGYIREKGLSKRKGYQVFSELKRIVEDSAQ